MEITQKAEQEGRNLSFTIERRSGNVSLCMREYKYGGEEISATVGIPLEYIIRKISPHTKQIRLDLMGAGNVRVGFIERDKSGKTVAGKKIKLCFRFFGLKTHIIDIDEMVSDIQTPKMTKNTPKTADVFDDLCKKQEPQGF